MLTHLGVNANWRSAKGDCATRKIAATGSLLMRCDGSTGYALARYDFTMPESWSGTASPHVDALGKASYSLVKLDDRHVRVIVRTSGPSKVVVASVTVGFYS